MFTKPSQREAWRNRIYSGETVMSVWGGIENGLATPDTSPDELAPMSQTQLQWPKFGQYFETGGKSGEPVDMPEVEGAAAALRGLDERNVAPRARAGVARDARVARGAAVHHRRVSRCTAAGGARTLMNVPERGFYNWDPGRSSESTDPTRSGSVMLRYTPRRMLIMIPTLIVISFVTFVIIQLPPGDFLSNQIAELQSQGDKAAMEKAEFLRKQYGLDKPFLEQYAIWIGVWPGENGFSGLIQGDLGWLFEHDLPVKEVVGDRLLLSFILNFSVILFTWAVAFPIGFYRRRASTAGATTALPSSATSASPRRTSSRSCSCTSRTSSSAFRWAASWPRSTSGSLEHRQGALGARAPVDPGDRDWHVGHRRHDPRLRANLLDELQKPHVVTARRRACRPSACSKYPLRMALNPFIADIGNLLPSVISGSAIVAVVLSLQTSGPMLLEALRSQDQYLAGSFLMFLSSSPSSGCSSPMCCSPRSTRASAFTGGVAK